MITPLSAYRATLDHPVDIERDMIGGKIGGIVAQCTRKLLLRMAVMRKSQSRQNFAGTVTCLK